MKKNKIFGFLAFALMGVLIISSFASAYRGDPSDLGPALDEERHYEMLNAFENNDYEIWYDLMTEDGRHPRVVDIITEDNFEKFVESHNAAIAGDLEKSLELRTELGLNAGNGPHDGTGFGGHMGQHKGQGGKGMNKGRFQGQTGSRDQSCLE